MSMILSVFSSMFLWTSNRTKVLKRYFPMGLRKFFMNFKEEFALSTPHDVTEAGRRRLMILVMLGNIVGHVLLSATVSDRESGLLSWQLHMYCQSLNPGQQIFLIILEHFFSCFLYHRASSM